MALEPDQTFDLSSLFPSEEAFFSCCEEIDRQLTELEQISSTAGQSADSFESYWLALDQAGVLTTRVQYYPRLIMLANRYDQRAPALASHAGRLHKRCDALNRALDRLMIEVGIGTVRQWAATKAENIGYLARHLDRLERSLAHRLSPAEELIVERFLALQSTGETFSQALLSEMKFAHGTDSQGASFPMQHSQRDHLLSSFDRAVRQSAFESSADAFLAHRGSFAQALIAHVRITDTFAHVRGQTVLESKMLPHQLPTLVFHQMTDSFRQQLLPAWQRLFAAQQRRLGVSPMSFFDLTAPMAAPDDQRSVPFHQAVEWIAAAVAPLGQDYVEVLSNGCLEERWVHWACSSAKRPGAMSVSSSGMRPFILLHYRCDVASVSQLAHELGHSMNFYLSRVAQPRLYHRTSWLLSEIPSTVHQLLLGRHLLAENPTDQQLRRLVHSDMFAIFFRYLFLWPVFSIFEQRIYEKARAGDPLHSAVLIEMLADLFQECLGDTVSLDRSRVGIMWAQFSHFYTPFNIYNYSVATAAACQIAEALTGPDAAPFVAAYRNFLQSGCSADPLELLASIGIDPSKPNFMDSPLAFLRKLTQEYEDAGVEIKV